MTAPRAGCSALVLAGGAARRLGGRDKPAVVVGGTTLLDRVLAAVAGAGTERIVVVGPRRQLAAPPEGGVWWCREDPPGGGPVAAIAAGLAVVATPFVAVLAADLPFLTGREIELLRRGAEEPAAHAAVLVDPGGRRQYLAAVWRTARLRAALPADPVGRPVRGLFTDQVVTSVRADALACLDCDAPADVARARRWAGRVRPGTM
ncbi:molybdopterin-guanine dinucleotide biosynthesis protein A [Frankia torreyi]|uniref:Molybdopterin-guanine dinucleotide biosynthesis protein A n=1 Tax=Frankia torreyi TaxID=1856 RepID=A0A0D8BKX2_9ACTN|nr:MULTISPECIES: molybdenum cofactor guanylyltransferase [Frankia]KJE24634.1 molybdopterin-guanine dinucleotide biosynthesis protein A [Frankia torreyi]KQC37573.1 molybdopterin-guanine dinucleotide biosynthesis protein [Frankia sp. ACN1ag]KQM07661.1 molybdopterin-guanine dinucleotide biosynthesis protein A [Frankia sp. CpI1-P]